MSSPASSPAPASQPANQHARKHGAYSDSIVFASPEEKQSYLVMLEGFLAAWNPANEVELCAVHELAGCKLWFQRFEKADHQLWILGLRTVVDRRKKDNWASPENFAEYDVLAYDPANARELQRRRRHVATRYNRAMRELTMSRNERFAKEKAAARAAADKAKALKEAERLERKAAQEAPKNPALPSPQPVDSATQSVSASSEAPPPATL